MKRGSLLVVLVVVGVFAGCVTPATDVAPQAASSTGVRDQWWLGALPSTLSDEKHDHSDRAMHKNLTTPNFEVVGWDPLVTSEFNQTLTGQGCGGAALREDGRKLAIVHSISTTVSFVVADVTDPAAPAYMGEFYLPNAVVWDADISADGMHVLIAANDKFTFLPGDIPTLPVPPAASLRALTPTDVSNPLVIKFRDCNGVERDASPLNYAPGPAIIMVGIQDPQRPVFEDYVPQPWIGPHSVTSALIDGTLYATSSVTNLVHEGSYYTFFEISGDRLDPLSVLQTPGHPTPPSDVGPFAAFGMLNGHTDVVIAKHPGTGQVLAHLANWNAYYVYDMTNPRMPVEISESIVEGSIHTTFPFPTMWGDRHYTVVGQEVGEPTDLPSGWIFLVDTTDPANPAEVGRWTLPTKPKWDDGGLMFSPHYVGLLNTTLFVTNYHGGMWALDVSDPAAPAAIGIFLPENESPSPYAEGTYGPNIEDVIVDPVTGILTTWDGAGGIYQLRFHETMPSFRAPAWSGELAD